LLIGVGLGSGSLVLTKFNAWNGDEPDGIEAAVQTEFIPKVNRPSNTVAWNPMNNSQIAVGLEKIRGDFSTLIWDVQHGGTKKKGEASRPARQLANAESVVALSWLPGQPQCLATGTGLKWLRMYDLRTSNAQPRSVIAHSKSVHGVKFDKLRPHMLATFSEGSNEPIKIWDVRRLGAEAKPAVVLQPAYGQLNKVTHLAWLPTRAGILATSGPKQPWIALWDINKGLLAKNAISGGGSGNNSSNNSAASTPPSRSEGNDHEPEVITKPFRRRYAKGQLSTFAWQYVKPHVYAGGPPVRDSSDTIVNRILAVSHIRDGSKPMLEDIPVQDALPLGISCTNGLATGYGKSILLSECALRDCAIAGQRQPAANAAPGQPGGFGSFETDRGVCDHERQKQTQAQVQRGLRRQQKGGQQELEMGAGAQQQPDKRAGKQGQQQPGGQRGGGSKGGAQSPRGRSAEEEGRKEQRWAASDSDRPVLPIFSSEVVDVAVGVVDPLNPWVAHPPRSLSIGSGLKEDISERMRRRIIAGYSVSVRGNLRVLELERQALMRSLIMHSRRASTPAVAAVTAAVAGQMGGQLGTMVATDSGGVAQGMSSRPPLTRSHSQGSEWNGENQQGGDQDYQDGVSKMEIDGVVGGGVGIHEIESTRAIASASVAQAVQLHLHELERLRQLWLWLGRIRRMHHGLAESGVQALLRTQSSTPPQICKLASLGCTLYTSLGRSLAIRACGWEVLGDEQVRRPCMHYVAAHSRMAITWHSVGVDVYFHMALSRC
jgi:hypothetical protein